MSLSEKIKEHNKLAAATVGWFRGERVVKLPAGTPIKVAEGRGNKHNVVFLGSDPTIHLRVNGIRVIPTEKRTEKPSPRYATTKMYRKYRIQKDMHTGNLVIHPALRSPNWRIGKNYEIEGQIQIDPKTAWPEEWYK